MPRLLRVGLLIHVLTEALFLNLAEVELTFALCLPWLCRLTILLLPCVFSRPLPARVRLRRRVVVSRLPRSCPGVAVVRPC